jgi:hypothetical protein
VNCCNSLGKAFAHEQVNLLVVADAEGDAARYFVEGALTVLDLQPPQIGKIKLLTAKGSAEPFREHRRAKSLLFSKATSPTHGRETNLLFAMLEADVAIVAGGGEWALRAALAASMRGAVVLPIGSFGGAGQALNAIFREGSGLLKSSPDMASLGILDNPWSESLVPFVVNLSGVRRRPQLMIVHGHDSDLQELKDFLQKDLLLPEPIIMRERIAPGHTMPQKFEDLGRSADGAIVLATPDDIGGSAADGRIEARARQNVWLELGWFWGRLGKSRTLLVLKGDTVIPSDLVGLEHAQYNDANDFKRAKDHVQKFVQSLHHSPHLSKLPNAENG